MTPKNKQTKYQHITQKHLLTTIFQTSFNPSKIGHCYRIVGQSEDNTSYLVEQRASLSNHCPLIDLLLFNQVGLKLVSTYFQATQNGYKKTRYLIQIPCFSKSNCSKMTVAAYNRTTNFLIPKSIVLCYISTVFQNCRF